jgi:hypothetical protein
MFDTIKTIDCHVLEKEIIKRVGENKFSKELDRYLFEGCENDSYNAISIEALKDDLVDAKDGYTCFEGQDLCDFIDTWEALIEIFNEEGIKETEDVVVWVCW